MQVFLLNPHSAMLFALGTDPTTGVDPVSWAVNYGIAGIVIALLVMGQLRTKAEVLGLEQRLAEANEREKEQTAATAALMAQITQHTLPQIANLADVLQQMPKRAHDPATGQLEGQMAEVKALLTRIEQRTGGA